ncbi:MAG: cache domain-containing protein [bacterium]|nr:cache domain-containing protein [bacterium]
MWSQFFLENIHFAINFFAALVFFAIFWLYWDAWRHTPLRRDFFRLIGFLLLAVSFVLEASQIEAILLPAGLNNSGVIATLLIGARIMGYFLVLVGMILDPLPTHPNVPTSGFSAGVVASSIPFSFLYFLFPLGAVSVAFMYLRRATLGLERHMRTAAIGYFLLSISHLFGLAVLFQNSSNSRLNFFVAPFGFFWFIENIFVATGIYVLGCWVWQYLLTRVKTQFFLVFTSVSLVVFIVTVTLFTGLLLANMQTATLNQLASDNKIMNLALDSKKAELSAYAKTIAENNQLISALKSNDRPVLASIAEKGVINWKINSLLVLDPNGKVLARGENNQNVGDSFSDNGLVKRGLAGQGRRSLTVVNGPVAPMVFVRAVEPVLDGNKITGVVMASMLIDNAFVDGIKQATGLETAIYGDNVLSASTILSTDGKSRWVGIKETNKKITEKVLKQGELVVMSKRMVNSPYLASFAPLRDADNVVIGMVFVGKPEISILVAAGQSLSYTFMITALLIVFSLLPAYLLARHFAYQLR